MFARRDEIPRTRRPRRHAVWQGAPLRSAVEYYVLGRVFCDDGQTEKGATRIQRVAQCDVTGLPQHLGQDQWWNQVVIRFHVPRTTHCHHCHRIFDHKLSVREDMLLFWEGLNHTLRSFFIFTDWYDGGNGSAPREPGQPDERGDCVCHRPFSSEPTRLSHRNATGHDWKKETGL